MSNTCTNTKSQYAKIYKWDDAEDPTINIKHCSNKTRTCRYSIHTLECFGYKSNGVRPIILHTF